MRRVPRLTQGPAPRYHRRRMTSPDESAEFTTRFRLTRADARAALWFAAPEWVGWLIGVALLTVICATWPALGRGGRIGVVLFPVLTALKLLSLLHRSTKSADAFGGRELVLTLNHEGLGFDSGLASSLLRWPAVRRIVRGPSVWLFYSRDEAPFFIPTAAIPVEARALVARWAGEAGARLT